MENPWRFVSSPDFHIKGTTQSAKLKIDLDRENLCCPVGRDHSNTEEGGREAGAWEVDGGDGLGPILRSLAGRAHIGASGGKFGCAPQVPLSARSLDLNGAK